jgi:hypothetical protein
MSVAGILERIGLAKQRLDTQRADAYRQLVEALADGREVDPAAAAAALERERLTHADLVAAVEALAARRRAQAAYDRGKSLPAQREKAHQSMLAADAALETAVAAARKKHEAAVGPLRERLAELDRIEREAQAGERLLRNGDDRPEVVAEIAAAQQRLDAAKKAQAHPLAEAHAAQLAARSVHAKLDPLHIPPAPHFERGPLEEQLKQLAREEASCLRRAEELGAAVLEAGAELAAAESKLLEV